MRAILTALLIAGLLSLTPSASASAPRNQCDEAWQAPRSVGAQSCRDAGWTIRPRFVLNPRNVVKAHRFTPCTTDEAETPCYWDAQRMGNHRGESYIYNGRHVFYVSFRH